MNPKRNWKIIYSNYSGAEKKAVELLTREVGGLVLRDSGIYTIHVLACEHASDAVIDKNAIVVGTYDENPAIQKYIEKSEIPENGYVVKVIDNPENADLKLALITAHNPREVFYGAADFVDDYFTVAAVKRGWLFFDSEVFEQKIPDYYNASAPAVRTRNVWTWGHPIDDYKEYIDNMARLKLNQVTIWNDFVPLNAKEIVDYAHEYGIEVIWGYAWGWSRNCTQVDFENLDGLGDEIVAKYEKEYLPTGADGIYFQSFTELHEEYIGNRLIADVVTEFVNKTAEKLLAKYPHLHIQFGLHATSVKERLEYIAKVDRRISIVWEDCGAFPYNYIPQVKNEAEYEDTVEFTDKILALRDGEGFGALYKGHLVQDWEGDKFSHQSGPFVLGVVSEKTKQNDIEIAKPIWKRFQTGWQMYGRYAYDMTRHIAAKTGGDTLLGIVGNFNGGMWFSYALCAQILWECDKPYNEIYEKVANRKSITMV